MVVIIDKKFNRNTYLSLYPKGAFKGHPGMLFLYSQAFTKNYTFLLYGGARAGTTNRSYGA